jgi:putative transposase
MASHTEFRTGHTRTGHRNGSYTRALTTRVGTITLEIPRDREGNFSPSLFERYERREQAFMLALIERYFQGVSTRNVTKVVEELCGASIAASTVSALTRKLDVVLEAWRRRRLPEARYRYLVVDAHYEEVCREGHVLSTAALWVVGITDDGYREHLGIWSGASESTMSWGAVFGDLIERGLKGVEYVVSDEHKGLVQALRRYFPDAQHQRCQVHYLRNALAHVTSDALLIAIKRGFHDAWAAPTRDSAFSVSRPSFSNSGHTNSPRGSPTRTTRHWPTT